MINIDLTKEIATIEFDDKRLNKRCLNLVQKLGEKPEKSIPSACNTKAETKAAYRFLMNDKVTVEKILAPHKEATIHRCQGEKVVLYIEDTTEIDYTNNSKLQKLGRLDHLNRKGFYCHAALAVTTTGLPLGILSTSFFDRDETMISYKRNYRKTPKEDKESYRWIEGIKNASELSAQMTDTKVVYIADREGDTYQCLYEAKKPETRCEVIIRACKDRNTRTSIKGTKKHKRLFTTMEEMEVQGEVNFRTQSGHEKKARNVNQTLRYGQVTLKSIQPQTTGYEDINMNVIMLKEEKPPCNCKGIDWILITTMPIDTLENVMTVVKYYLMRWKIEIYFKFLKVYCKIEELKLIEKERLQTCVAIYMVIAWRLLLLHELGESYPEEDCTLAFTDLEWKVVFMKLLKLNKRPLSEMPIQTPTMRDFINKLASLGGFLGRKCDGRPGPKSICQGYVYMIALVEGWELCQQQNCG